METGDQLASRHERWQRQTTFGGGVDAYSVEPDLLDQVTENSPTRQGEERPLRSALSRLAEFVRLT